MNKRQKKKQVWLKWIGGSYKSAKQRERQQHEELITFKRKAWVGHLTDKDIENFWFDLSLFPLENIKNGSIFRRRKRRKSKTDFKKSSKALAYCNLKR